MTDRRRFLLTSLAAVLGAPLGVRAQSTKTPRIGILGVTALDPALEAAFGQGLHESRYTDGVNVVIDKRDADGRPERLPLVAADFVRHKVDVLFARGAGALAAAKAATSRIPIVAVDLETDPRKMGFVRTLAQPGGNITGVFLDLPELSGKQLQLVREVIRPISRVAILGDPVLNVSQFEATQAAARALALESQLLEVRASKDFEPAFDAAINGRAMAVLLLSSPLVFTNRAEIAMRAKERRLPAISMFVEFVEAGGLMAYGPSLREAFRLSGAYVGRVLQGAEVGKLPVQRPTKFDLVFNLKTARALGLTVPPAVLMRADRVIE